MPSLRNRFLLFLSLTLAHLCVAQQIVEHLSFDRPESWAMKYFTAVGSMQGNAPPEALAKGRFALGFDLSNIPSLSKAERTVGFNGIKEENMNKAPILARPLVHFGITDKLSVTGSYVPPVEVFDRLETHLMSLSFNYNLFRRDRLLFNLRGGGQWSRAEGDFTCPADIAGIMDPEINPFGCEEPSQDQFTSASFSLEGNIYYSLPTSRPVDLFISTTYTYADLDFRVDAHWAGGFEDKRELKTSGDIWSFGAGLRASITERIQATLAIIHTPLDVRRPQDYEVENESLTYFRLSIALLL